MSYFYLPLLPIGEIKRAKALIGDGISVSRKGVKALDHDLLQDGGVGDGEVGGRHVILTPHLAKPELNCLVSIVFFSIQFSQHRTDHLKKFSISSSCATI